MIWKALIPLSFPETDNYWFANDIFFTFIFIFCQLTIVEYMIISAFIAI